MVHFGQYSYLITTIIFAAGAVLIEWLLCGRVLSRHRKLICAIALILMIATAPAEMFALRWRVWTYNPDRTFHTRFLGAEVETYFYALVVAIAVASATVVFARYEDRGLPLLKTVFFTKLKKKLTKQKGF